MPGQNVGSVRTTVILLVVACSIAFYVGLSMRPGGSDQSSSSNLESLTNDSLSATAAESESEMPNAEELIDRVHAKIAAAKGQSLDTGLADSLLRDAESREKGIEEILSSKPEQRHSMRDTLVESEGTLMDQIYANMTPEKVVEAQGLILDSGTESDQRLKALRTLRFQPSDAEVYSAEVTDAISVWLDEATPEVRTRIIKNIHRSQVDQLKEPLLDYLDIDPDPKVRAAAAKRLAYCLDDDRVRNSLIHSSDHDEDSRVRDRAADALEKMEDLLAKRDAEERP